MSAFVVRECYGNGSDHDDVYTCIPCDAYVAAACDAVTRSNIYSLPRQDSYKLMTSSANLSSYRLNIIGSI